MRIAAVIVCAWMAFQTAWSQEPGSNLRKTVQDAAAILGQAGSDGAANAVQTAADKAVAQGLTERLASQVGTNAPPIPERQVVQAEAQRLQKAASDLAPVGQAPAVRIPAGGSAPSPPAAAAKTPDASGKKTAGTEIVITCQGAAYFDSAQANGVFIDDVEVHHPQFHLVCDELEVYMVKDSDKPKTNPPQTAGAAPGGAAPPLPPASPAKNSDPAAKPAAEGQSDSSIKQAIARGRRVIIEKMSEEGVLQIGICRHATYDGATGDLYMRDWPQVQRGKDLTIATSATTFMVLKQNGELVNHGPTTTKIIQQTDANAPKPGAPGGAPAPAPAPPPPKPLPSN